MNRKFYILVGLALILSMGNAMSQETDGNDEDEMDVTMRLMGKAEAELPDAVIKPITLPDAVLKHNSESPAVAASEHGMIMANKLHGEEGLQKADAARERASEMSNQAQNDRETHGRSEDRPEPPPRPENPGPPGEPPGQN